MAGHLRATLVVALAMEAACGGGDDSSGDGSAVNTTVAPARIPRA